MIWLICFILSIFVFIASIGVFVYVYSDKRFFSKPRIGINIMFVATAVSAYLLCLPINIVRFSSGFDGLLLAIQNMLQIFSLDSSFVDFCESAQIESELLQTAYIHFGAFLHFIAPILTVSFVLTFFRGVMSFFRLNFGFYKNLYVFTELNDKTFQFAKDCIKKDYENDIASMVLFTDTYETNDEISHELIIQANSISAICTKKDILSIKFAHLLKRKNIVFIVLGSDEKENLNHTLSLIGKYGANKRAKLYSFVSSSDGELLISSSTTSDVKMQVRTINSEQSFVYNYFYKNDVYQNYILTKENKKKYSIVLVGLHRYGMEFLKCLLWVYQQPEYDLQLHIFAQEPDAQQIFEAQCPEIMKYSGNYREGESNYTINFYNLDQYHAFNSNTKAFDDKIVEIGEVTAAYLTLDDDEDNIELAIRIRQLFARHFENEPEIFALVANTIKTKAIVKHELANFKDQKYNIKFLANINDVFSYDVIFNSALEREAIERHLDWYKKENVSQEIIEEKSLEFFRYKYFYKSSMASVIRNLGRVRANIAGADKKPSERTEQEKIAIRMSEHMGWNTYMRTEGYSYGEKRNDLAKTHPDLVDFASLSYEEQIKDEY